MKKLKLEALGRVTPETFKTMKKLPIVLVADDIRSGLNVGAFFRSSDAFGIEKIILCGLSPAPPHKEINKSAIGATLSMDWAYEKDIATALKDLKDKNYTIIGIEQTNESIALSDFTNIPDKLAIVMGNEVDGISDVALDLLDMAIDIPQYGTKHSLNVAVCAGVCLYDISNKMRAK